MTVSEQPTTLLCASEKARYRMIEAESWRFRFGVESVPTVKHHVNGSKNAYDINSLWLDGLYNDDG